jgi:hypothetical protein
LLLRLEGESLGFDFSEDLIGGLLRSCDNEIGEATAPIFGGALEKLVQASRHRNNEPHGGCCPPFRHDETIS